MPDSAKVNTPNAAYEEMAKLGRWDLLERLMGGTLPMQEAGRKYLPKFDGEDSQDYAARLESTVLFGSFAETVKGLVSKPFCKPVTWEDDLPEALAALQTDVDGMGTSPTEFARKWFEDGVLFGLGHALPDLSRIPENDPGIVQNRGRVADRMEEQRRGARPKFIRITPPNLIDWVHGTVNGKRVLAEIRFRGSKEVRDGFETKNVPTVTHYTREWVQLYERKGDQNVGEEWVAGEQVPLRQNEQPLESVPLVTWYTNRTGEMLAKPPLLALAENALDHWQTFSDYKSLVHVVSVAMLFTKGWQADDKGSSGSSWDGKISPKSRIHATPPEADAKWLEVTGAGLAQLESALDRNQERGETLGHQPTSRNRSPVTATGEIHDNQETVCDLQAWTGALEDGLRRLDEESGKWVGVTDLSEETRRKVFRGFTIGPEREKEIDQLQVDEKDGRITTERYLTEAQRRGLYGDDLVPEEEAQAARDEAMENASAFLGGEGEDDPDPPVPGDPEADAA